MAKRVAKTAREVPTIGELYLDPDGWVRGWIKGACGCATHFEMGKDGDKGGCYPLFGISDAKSKHKSLVESGPEDAP